MIILFGNKKGGVGKSCTLVNLAGAIMARATRQGTSHKHLVCIVDADTNETIVNYISRREEYSQKLVDNGLPELSFIKVEGRKPDSSLTRDLHALNEIYKYVLVDTGGYENKAFKSAIPVADFVYLPFQASQVDLEQLIPTLYVIGQIEENMRLTVDEDFSVDARLMLSKVEHNSRDLFVEAKNICKDLLPYASISSVAIPFIKAINQVQDHGLTLSDPLPLNLKSKSLPQKDSIRRPHAKRAVFDMLLEEIDGTRKLESCRLLEDMSDASDITA